MQQSVSVVIVNYNGGPLLSECVQSVLDSTVPVEVFVSDNASRDASLIELRMRLGNDPRLTIIENRWQRAAGLPAKYPNALAHVCADPRS